MLYSPRINPQGTENHWIGQVGMQEVHVDYLIIRNTLNGEWEAIDGYIMNDCRCNKILQTVNWNVYYHGNGDAEGRGEKRKRITFPKLSLLANTYKSIIWQYFTYYRK